MRRNQLFLSWILDKQRRSQIHSRLRITSLPPELPSSLSTAGSPCLRTQLRNCWKLVTGAVVGTETLASCPKPAKEARLPTIPYDEGDPSDASMSKAICLLLE